MSKVKDLQPTRRAFIVGATLAAAGATAYAATPRKAEHRLAKAKLDDLIPATVGPWRFANRAGIVVPEAEGPVDGYDQVLTRVYQGDGLPAIMLLIAYGSTQGGSLQLHRPETCYPGQGFRLGGLREVDLDVRAGSPVHGRAFTASRDDRTEQLLYWTRISNTFPRNTAEEYGAIIRTVLTGVIPDGILVRVSTIAPDASASMAALERFAVAMIDGTHALGKGILVGNLKASEIPGTGAAHNR